ncbi:MAG: trypsin-like peptidase domain-containing protein [Planctomycetota bacterium]
MNHSLRAIAAALSASGFLAAVPFSQSAGVPPSPGPAGLRAAGDVPALELPPIDLKLVQLEDEMRTDLGDPPRYAIPYAVLVTPLTDGVWEDLDGGRALWRLRVVAPGALTLNLGFTDCQLPASASLWLHDAYDLSRGVRPFTAADNELHGELWTPVVPTEELMVELTLSWHDAAQLRLVLTHVGYGYRGFVSSGGGGRSGACNVDVVCPEGDPWRDEIPSVAVISTGGSTFCTGFLVNNTAYDGTPYFMTAYHCGVNAGNAASLVAYWNFENSTCRPPDSGSSGGPGDGTLNQFNTGSFFRSAYSTSDFTLVELDDDPSGFGVTWSGWDRTGADATSAVGIHHPNTDEKRISFEYAATQTTSYLGTSPPGDGTHVRIVDWDLGTTEPGSSGSPVYDQNHHVIGQLHGGYAACGNNLSDWYGKCARSWRGGGSTASRLSDWLDPLGSGATSVDTLASGLSVTPSGSVLHTGPVGGPFTNPTTTYTLENSTAAPLDYRVSLTASFGILLDGGVGPVTGTLAIGGTAQVVVSLGPDIDALGAGAYEEDVVFTDLSAGLDKTRHHTVDIGRVSFYSFPFDTSPGWTVEGQWAFGHPTGGGGQYGYPDPTNGYTGTNVYGYNLAGDYANNLPERHLTTTALDCTDIQGTQLRFWRWLNVESPSFDHARLRVSRNGTTWTTVWENASEVTENAWAQASYDISAVADGQSTVYVRWTMGPTDGSWQYSGWNIDDVEVWGFPAATAGASFRNGGTNPASYVAVTLPVLGTTYTATVDLGGTTGHSLAWLVGYSTPATLTLGGGQTLLVNIADPNGEILGQPFVPGPLATYNVPVPSDPALAGFPLATQALHSGGVTPFALSNAQDLLLGY